MCMIDVGMLVSEPAIKILVYYICAVCMDGGRLTPMIDARGADSGLHALEYESAGGTLWLDLEDIKVSAKSERHGCGDELTR